VWLPVRPEADTLKQFNDLRFLKVHYFKHATKILAMIQRTFLTPFRAAGASIRIASRSTILRPQYRTNNSSIVQRLRPISAARWYATEPEQHKAPEEESQIAGEAPKESIQVDDAAKKELEAKNKEIIELKVSHHLDIFRHENQNQCRD